MIFYSSKMGGFYRNEIHGSNMPDDVVQITESDHSALIAGQSQGKRIQQKENGYPVLVDPPEPNVEEIAAIKRRDIDLARDTAFSNGLAYDIAGEPDVVQTRPQDQINLLGLNAKAQRLIAAGDTETLMDFRGESNVTRKLTATEMDVMTMTALEHIEGIYQQSWDRKDAIRSALETEDREGLEAIEWSNAE